MKRGRDAAHGNGTQTRPLSPADVTEMVGNGEAPPQRCWRGLQRNAQLEAVPEGHAACAQALRLSRARAGRHM